MFVKQLFVHSLHSLTFRIVFMKFQRVYFKQPLCNKTERDNGARLVYANTVISLLAP